MLVSGSLPSGSERRGPSVKSNWNVFIAVCVGAVAGFAVGQHMGSKGGSLGTPLRNAPQAAPAPAPAAPPGSDQIFKVALGDAPQHGSADAKVTIVEWSDFQCPFCSRVIDTLREIEKSYGADVRFAFKQNPLPMHPDAPYAAKASIAAQRQGKFWQMHDKLFEASASHQPDALKQDKVDAMARDLGLDLERYQRDVSSPETEKVIRDDQAQAAKLGAGGTPHFFINGARVSGAMPYDSFKVVIDAQLKRANAALATGVAKKDLYEFLVKDGMAGPPAPPQAAPQPQARNVDPGDGPWIGSRKPKVTIVEWSDFQCPFCARVEPTLKQVLDTYKDDVRIVWRNEPLSFHQNAMPAAKAAMAAARQGNEKFWKMHGLMFSHQNELSEAKYVEWAKQSGLDVARWRKDKESPEVAALIAKDNSYAQSVGADGTPSFFINGRFVSGAMPFDTFKGVIDEQVRKADELLKKGVKQEALYQALVDENVKAAGGPALAAGQGAAGVEEPAALLPSERDAGGGSRDGRLRAGERQVLGDARPVLREAERALAGLLRAGGARDRAGRAEVEGDGGVAELAGGDPGRHDRRQRGGRQRNADLLHQRPEAGRRHALRVLQGGHRRRVGLAGREEVTSRPWPASRRCRRRAARNGGSDP